MKPGVSTKESPNESGLLDWISSDRATVMFQDLDDAKAKEEAFVTLVRSWVNT